MGKKFVDKSVTKEIIFMNIQKFFSQNFFDNYFTINDNYQDE